MESLPIELMDPRDEETAHPESIDELRQVPLDKRSPEKIIKVSLALNQEDFTTLVQAL